MRQVRFLLVLVTAIAAIAAASFVRTTSAAAAKPCKAGSSRAALPWGTACLRAGQSCRSSRASAYRRYGFRCRSGRLARIAKAPRPAPPASTGGADAAYAGRLLQWATGYSARLRSEFPNVDTSALGRGDPTAVTNFYGFLADLQRCGSALDAAGAPTPLFRPAYTLFTGACADLSHVGVDDFVQGVAAADAGLIATGRTEIASGLDKLDAAIAAAKGITLRK